MAKKKRKSGARLERKGFFPIERQKKNWIRVEIEFSQDTLNVLKLLARKNRVNLSEMVNHILKLYLEQERLRDQAQVLKNTHRT